MLHSHALSIDGVGIPLGMSGGPGHYHVAEHPVIGDIRTNSMSDDQEHRHQFVGPDGTLYQTGMPIDADPGVSAEPGASDEPEPTAKSGDAGTRTEIFPSVLTWEAVRTNEMPETGSGIPDSLEAGIPAQFRYWKATNPSDRLAIRRALVESGTLVPDTVRMVATRTDAGRSEPILMRVQDTGTGLVPVVEPDGPVHVPRFDDDIVVAAKSAGLGPTAKIFTTETVSAVTSLTDVTFATLLKRALDSGDEWLFELRAGSAEETLVTNRYDGCCGFRLPHSDAATYFSSGLPEEGSVRFVRDPGSGVQARLDLSRNMTSLAITTASETGPLTPHQRDVGIAYAELAQKSVWDTGDLRTAHRVRVLLDSELARAPSDRRTSLLKALGVDTETAGQEILAKTDTIKLRKFHDADPDDAKRLVWGVVLEPDVGDLQGDVLTEETIERAFYNYAEYHRHVGIQHQEIADDRARITQIYLAPCDFIPQGCGPEEMVRKGSWVQEYRIVCDDLWLGILCGEFTGFSIGGYGTRIPIAP